MRSRCARGAAGGIWGRPTRTKSLLGPPSGLVLGCEARRAEAMTAMVDGERAIELRVDLDADASVAAPIPARVKLDEPASELDGVIMADRARILEAADAVEH